MLNINLKLPENVILEEKKLSEMKYNHYNRFINNRRKEKKKKICDKKSNLIKNWIWGHGKYLLLV